MRDHRETLLQALIGLAPQFIHLVIGKLRQNRITAIGHEGATSRDFHRIFNRLRKICKERDHLLLAFEIMLCGQAATWFRLIDIGPFGNTDQRIMRLVHLGFGKIDVIGRHQGQIHRVGHLHMAPLGQGFRLRLAVLARMALQLYIKAVREHLFQALHQCLSGGALSLLQQFANRPLRPTCEAD